MRNEFYGSPHAQTVTSIKAHTHLSARGQSPVTPHPPPGLADRTRRLLWKITWTLLARPTPVPFHGWRRLLLRLFGARIGKGAVVYPSAKIWAPWNLTLADGSCLAEGVDCYNVARITLGAGAIVSQRAFLCSASHDPHRADFPLITGPIDIGAKAWIAAEAFVGPGVAIASHAVVAARAVVVRSVPEDKIVGGNPAKVIGHRKTGKQP